MAQDVQTPPSLLMSPDMSPQSGRDVPMTPGAAAIKLCPFNLVGRGVAGIDEMKDSMDDSKVLFGLLQIQVGSGHFARRKNIFIHFNSENHPKPLQRAKANKKMAKAQALMGQFHVTLVVPNKQVFSINWVFQHVNQLFVADNVDSSDLKSDYLALMKQAAKEAHAAKAKLAAEKKRREEEMRLKAEKEEEERLAQIKEEEDDLRRVQEEKERDIKEAQEAADKLKKEKEAEAEAAKKAAKENESKPKDEADNNKDSNDTTKTTKKGKKGGKKISFMDGKTGDDEDNKPIKKKRRKKRKKDDWSNEREWTATRVLKAVHADFSPFNWAIFAPHNPTGKKELECVKWGHGSIANLREHLDETCVQYGIMRLAFGSGKFKRSHFVFCIWTPDTMTAKAPQAIRSKKNKERMLHVSWKDHMKETLAPCNVTVVAESIEKVGVEEWILRVRNTVVVDSGDALTAESIQKALEEEKKWLETLRKKQEEETAKRRAMEKRERQKSQKLLQLRMTAQKEKNAEAGADITAEVDKIKLKSTNSNGNSDEDDDNDSKTTSDHEDGSNGSHGSDIDDDEDESGFSLSVSIDDNGGGVPDPIVVKLSAEEVKKIEEERRQLADERKKAEAGEAKRKRNRERHFQDVLASQICYESIQLVHNEKETTCWCLFEPKPPRHKR